MKEVIADNLKSIYERIDLALAKSGREDQVTLIGVSKLQDIEKIRIASSLGLDTFGENYIQEGVSKIISLREEGLGAKFHFIGGLQSNKVKDAVRYFDVIQSIDSVKLIDAVVKVVRGGEKISQDILIQVNVSSEGQKSGIEPEKAMELVAYANEKPEINVLGLMGIGSFTDDLSLKLGEFKSLATLKLDIERQLSFKMPHLSMGMSDDFEIAIEEGSTMVRIGSLLFGKRVKR